MKFMHIYLIIRNCNWSNRKKYFWIWN